ncbi:MutS-related protein [Spirochaeta lutea]|uniref:MutS-related protein n=1 Tax=Spirochaeta lutea TaxID=1480694 RepID=UPI000568407D|nr:hypothetical protein [Spirochaeta lutea]
MDDQRDSNRTPLSLLWPPGLEMGEEQTGRQLDPQTITDLGIDKLLTRVFPNRWERASQEPILTRLIDDPRVLAYRQGIFENILHAPQLHSRLEEAAQHLLYSRQVPTPGKTDKSPLMAVARKITQLESYLTGVQLFGSILQDSRDTLTAPGFQQILAQLEDVRRDPLFTRLETQLPQISNKLRSVKSISIGVNLDSYLRPISAVLTDIHDKPIPEAKPGMFGRLLGADSSGPAALGSFHPPMQSTGSNRENPLLVPILQDVNQVMEKTARSLVADLQPFQNLQGGFFEHLGRELIFYLRLASYLGEFKTLGLPFCTPVFTPGDTMKLLAQGCWNLRLAELFRHDGGSREGGSLARRLVANDLYFDGAYRGFVLTGPNRGGKTVYLQSIGILVVLAQVGALVPAESCSLSPVDGIFTHYQIEERPEAQAGRLGEESLRVRELFSSLGPRSLVLMNESFASTSPGEAGVLLRDILEVLADSGIRCIVATHLHSLAADIAQEHPSIGSLISVVAQSTHDDAPADRAEPAQEAASLSGETQAPRAQSVPASGRKTEAARSNAEAAGEAPRRAGPQPDVPNGAMGAEDDQNPRGQRTYKIILAPPTGKSYALDVARHYKIDRESLEALLQTRLGPDSTPPDYSDS